MGLYDEIRTALYCPYCGQRQRGFQTKALSPPGLRRLSLEDFRVALLAQPHGYATSVTGALYMGCADCGEWIEVVVTVCDSDNLKHWQRQWARWSKE